MRLNLLLLFLFSSYCIAQEKLEFKVVDSVNSLNISDAYILLDGAILTTSDINGVFEIDNNIHFNRLQISHIGYKPFFIDKNKIDSKKPFFLVENYFELTGLVLNNQKSKKTLLPSLSENSRDSRKKSVYSNEAAHYATFIPNDESRNATIKGILIEMSKGHETNLNKQYMPFKVNLYKVNKETSLPGDKVLKESILTYKKIQSNETYIYVDISEFAFDLPTEGIFVVIETMTIIENESYSHISAFPPAFTAIKKTKASNFRTYQKIYDSQGKRLIIDWVQKGVKLPTFILNFGVELEYY